jgi:hypothetical protein
VRRERQVDAALECDEPTRREPESPTMLATGSRVMRTVGASAAWSCHGPRAMIGSVAVPRSWLSLGSAITIDASAPTSSVRPSSDNPCA